MNPQLHRLRVAMLASSLRLGGAEKQTVYMARALLHAGMDLRFFYLGGGGHYETVLREMGVPVRQIYFPNQPWKILVKLIAALSRVQPHIVLASQFGDLRFGGIAGRCCNALIVGGVRSNGWYELRTYGWLGRRALRLAHGFVTNSHSARQTLTSQGVKSQKIEVLPNVIDLRDFDARSALPFPDSLPADRVIVAAVGSLQPCKRFDRFLEALALARRSETALAGVIAGADYAEGRPLLERAKALGLTPPDLIFLGECDRVPALLTRSAMLVLTSDYEGFPNVILEAMAARLPVITTPVGDAGVIVRHGQSGYVVQPDDPQSLAAAMVKLARSPSLRTDLGRAGRKRVEHEYPYEALLDRLLWVFRRFADLQPKSCLLEMLEHGVLVRKTMANDVAMESSGPLVSVQP